MPPRADVSTRSTRSSASWDQRRCSLELSKAALARRANLRPEVIRRLFSAERPNPTLSTLVALAEALEMELAAEPLEQARVS